VSKSYAVGFADWVWGLGLGFGVWNLGILGFGVRDLGILGFLGFGVLGFKTFRF
jgi:hypothetical protein